MELSDLKLTMERFSNWEERYSYIIALGKELAPMKSKEEKFLVKGCQSQVWLIPNFNGKTVHFTGDSDALISKGLLALLLSLFNNKTPQEILNTPDTFLKDLGILEHISMNRTNGVLSMLKQIKLYAVVFAQMNGPKSNND